jgi:hypothetical protein
VGESLGEQYPKEQARVRRLLELYATIPTGGFAHAMISNVLKEADEAAISGDLPRMIRAFKEMQGCE